MATHRPRRLFLHLSALSDDEYAVYLGALKDVLDVEDEGEGKTMREEDELELEGREIGVREVRAWVKGRYRDVRPGDIDRILHFFSTSFEPKDVLSGGQFLAALRLLMHVQNGGEVLEGNVFVQANVTTASPSRATRNLSPTSPDPPSNDGPSAGFSNTATTSSSHNPFTNNTSPPRLPVRRSSISHLEPRSSNSDPSGGFTVIGRSSLETKRLPSSDVRSSNPFLQRSKTHAGTNRIVSRSSDGDVPPPTGANDAPRVPPLPPRKPSHMHAPSSSSKPPPAREFSTSIFTVTNKANGSPPKNLLPLPPPPPAHPNPPTLSYVPLKSTSPSFISPLMKQSLEASKAGNALKRAQQLAEKERVLEVIQSSSSKPIPSRGTSADGPTSRVPPPIPLAQHRRPAPSPPPSTTSTASLERVASARLTPRVGSPDRASSSASSTSTSHHQQRTRAGSGEQRERERQSPTTSTFPPPPPTHPHRRPSGHRHTSSFHHPPTTTTARGSSPISDSLAVDASPPQTAKTSRSHSVHHPPSSSGSGSGFGMGGRAGSPPAPPVRRKRPESMQIGYGYGGSSSSLASPFGDSATTKVSPSRGLFSPSSTVTSHSSPSSSTLFTSSTTSTTSRSALEAQQQQQASSPSAAASNANISNSSSSTSPLGFSAFQRAFTTSFQALQNKAQPALDRAKYKTEAGLAPRRGYVRDVRHGRGGLLQDADMSNNYDEDEDDYGVEDEEFGGRDEGMSPGSMTTNDELGVDGDVDEGDDSLDRGERSRARVRSGTGGGVGASRWAERERDDLKLPVGQADGWAQL